MYTLDQERMVPDSRPANVIANWFLLAKIKEGARGKDCVPVSGRAACLLGMNPDFPESSNAVFSEPSQMVMRLRSWRPVRLTVQAGMDSCRNQQVSCIGAVEALGRDGR